ncbi:MAG: class I SAM-dependent methyltransferase [Planctomycetes bacterium]|nr:class I SAM-dependent methyltransferase [Planctomycetota bacterium]
MKPAKRRWDRSPASLFDRYVRREKDARSFLFRVLPKGGACAEIGVWKGAFSRHIVEQSRPSKLYLVDPWIFQPSRPGTFFGGALAKSQADMDQIHDDVARDIGARPGVTILRAPSVEAARQVPDASLDWVYIDGDHAYDAVRADLEAWFPKIKPGGLVSGDDYAPKTWQDTSPVRRAVDEFVASGRVSVVVIRNSQFVLRKP